MKRPLAALILPLLCLLSLARGEQHVPAASAALLEGVKKIVFLGDSITQHGGYVVDVECWLLANGIETPVINLGLGSETATDLTAEENAGHKEKHGFGRPSVSERLDRVLEKSKPDLLIACYGMNDASSLPPDESGTKRYADAITVLRDKALKAGVKRVVICTPPIYDDKGDPKQAYREENLVRYTDWLLSKRADGWIVVDIHTPMRKMLDERRAENPKFMFASDGVHPSRLGHWVMAREILQQALGANLDEVSSAEDLFGVEGAKIRRLVNERMTVQFSANMTVIGHQRPGVAGGPGTKARKKGMTMEEAEPKVVALSGQISELLNDVKAAQ